MWHGSLTASNTARYVMKRRARTMCSTSPYTPSSSWPSICRLVGIALAARPPERRVVLLVGGLAEHRAHLLRAGASVVEQLDAEPALREAAQWHGIALAGCIIAPGSSVALRAVIVDLATEWGVTVWRWA